MMGYTMGHCPRVLVCEHDHSVRQQLYRKFETTGFWVDTAATAGEALAKLEQRRFDAMTISLVLSDQDSLTFIQDLRTLAIELPVLVTSIRATRGALPPAMAAALGEELGLDDGPEPEWVRKAADQARIIFAVKTACQQAPERRPRILHLEPDGFSAGLVNAALGKHTDLRQVRAPQDLDDALCQGPYDFVLFNPLFEDDMGEALLHRIASVYPRTPIVLHTQYQLRHDEPDLWPLDHDMSPAGFGLIQALRNLVLHGAELPQRAHA